MTYGRHPRVGERIGSYEIVRPLGSGGMGSVYEAVHSVLGRRVALKVLHATDTADVEARERRDKRFMGEGRAAAQIRHPNVVDVFDFGVDDGKAFLVMELVEGESFAQRLRRVRKTRLEEALEILLPIMSAVVELHATGIIHRDLKPANILLAMVRNGLLCPKLADFGVSRMTNGSGAVTQSGIVLGTPDYLSPELTRGTKEASEAGDQYALAVMLYEATTGRRPFEGNSTYELMHAIVTAEVSRPTAHEPSLPIALETVLLRAMARAPEDRYPSVAHFAAALLPFANVDVAARWRADFCTTEQYSISSTVVEAQGRHPRTAWLLAIAATGAIAAIGVIGSSSVRGHDSPVRAAQATLSTPASTERPLAPVPAPQGASRISAPIPSTSADPPQSLPATTHTATPARPPRNAPAPVHSARRTGLNGAPILEVE